MNPQTSVVHHARLDSGKQAYRRVDKRLECRWRVRWRQVRREVHTSHRLLVTRENGDIPCSGFFSGWGGMGRNENSKFSTFRSLGRAYEQTNEHLVKLLKGKGLLYLQSFRIEAFGYLEELALVLTLQARFSAVD